MHGRRARLGREDAGLGLAPGEQLAVPALVPLRRGEQRHRPREDRVDPGEGGVDRDPPPAWRGVLRTGHLPGQPLEGGDRVGEAASRRRRSARRPSLITWCSDARAGRRTPARVRAGVSAIRRSSSDDRPHCGNSSSAAAGVRGVAPARQARHSANHAGCGSGASSAAAAIAGSSAAGATSAALASRVRRDGRKSGELRQRSVVDSHRLSFVQAEGRRAWAAPARSGIGPAGIGVTSAGPLSGVQAVARAASASRRASTPRRSGRSAPRRARRPSRAGPRPWRGRRRGASRRRLAR